MKTLPKIFLLTAAVFIVAAMVSVPEDVVILICVLVIAFLLDVLFFQYERHREVLLWFVEHVQIIDKPIEESDAPESVKKLVQRGGDNSNS